MLLLKLLQWQARELRPPEKEQTANANLIQWLFDKKWFDFKSGWTCMSKSSLSLSHIPFGWEDWRLPVSTRHSLSEHNGPFNPLRGVVVFYWLISSACKIYIRSNGISSHPTEKYLGLLVPVIGILGLWMYVHFASQGQILHWCKSMGVKWGPVVCIWFLKHQY